jgi:hypothetical protein
MIIYRLLSFKKEEGGGNKKKERIMFLSIYNISVHIMQLNSIQEKGNITSEM